MKISTVTDYLEQFFPLELQEKWDKCGLQIGSLDHAVERVMVSLNCDLDTITKAVAANCELLITHHPFLLNEIVNYDTSTSYTQMLEAALANDLSVVSYHTCLDRGVGEESMNQWLLRKLPVSNIRDYDELAIGKMARLDQTYAPNQLIELVKATYDLPYVKVNDVGNKPIETIAICGGSGFGDVYELAGKVDCFISGDSKYHLAGDATAAGLMVIDASHHLEVVMEAEVARLLGALDLEVFTANSHDYLTIK